MRTIGFGELHWRGCVQGACMYNRHGLALRTSYFFHSCSLNLVYPVQRLRKRYILNSFKASFKPTLQFVSSDQVPPKEATRNNKTKMSIPPAQNTRDVDFFIAASVVLLCADFSDFKIVTNLASQVNEYFALGWRVPPVWKLFWEPSIKATTFTVRA